MKKSKTGRGWFAASANQLCAALGLNPRHLQMLPTDSPQRNWYQEWQQEIRQSAAELNNAENWSLQSAIRWR